MTSSAEVLLDSVSASGDRLTTFQVTTPRVILAEINTHRAFSRNYRSSRAVPVARLIEEVRTNPYEPIIWLKDKPGMQGGEPMTHQEMELARAKWLKAANQAATSAESLLKHKLHKQWSNRVIEPFLHVHGVISATELGNFFLLRDDWEAQPEFQDLAHKMREAIEASTPKLLQPGEWHLPYVTDEERATHPITLLLKLSAARCARVSYKLFDGTSTSVEKDLETYGKLVNARRLHASPFEHQATPDHYGWDDRSYEDEDFDHPKLHGNFVGWIQNRKILELYAGNVADADAWVDRFQSIKKAA